MTRYEVAAYGFDDRLIALVRGFTDRARARREAERLFARDDVNRVSITQQAATGNGRWR